MVKGCKHLCTTAFKHICKKSIIHELKKYIWKFCRSCSVYFKFTLLKSWICPCCHNQLRNKRRDRERPHDEKKLHKIKYYEDWYVKNRNKRLEYFRNRYIKNKHKNKKSLEEIAEIMK